MWAEELVRMTDVTDKQRSEDGCSALEFHTDGVKETLVLHVLLHRRDLQAVANGHERVLEGRN